MGRTIAFLILALAGVGSLAGCSQKHKIAEPDTLFKWAAEHGVTPLKLPPENANGRLLFSEDKHGYILENDDTETLGGRFKMYLVPVEALDSELPIALRNHIFPGGVATVSSGSENQPSLKIASGSVESLYFMIVGVENGARCDGFSKPCTAPFIVQVVGSLREGKKTAARRTQMLVFELQSGLLRKMALALKSDPQSASNTCGFDPDNDRLPHHVAAKCRALLSMRWGLANDFMISPLGASPLTPTALKLVVDEAFKEKPKLKIEGLF